MDGFVTSDFTDDDNVTNEDIRCVVPILAHEDRTGMELEDGSWIHVYFPRMSPDDFGELERIPGIKIVDLVDIVLYALDRGYLEDPLYWEIGRTVE